MTDRPMIEAPRSVIVSKAEMLRYHDPERIQSYCQSCDKYGLYWSCPPFAEQPFPQLAEWTDALLVTQKTWLRPGSTQEEVIQQFLDARQAIGELVISWESAGATAVVAGHCFGCSGCTRAKGVACCAPSRLHYSLEALGFDVTGLAEGLAGQTLHWPANGLPDYLIMVAALLCPSREAAIALLHG